VSTTSVIFYKTPFICWHTGTKTYDVMSTCVHRYRLFSLCKMTWNSLALWLVEWMRKVTSGQLLRHWQSWCAYWSWNIMLWTKTVTACLVKWKRSASCLMLFVCTINEVFVFVFLLHYTSVTKSDFELQVQYLNFKYSISALVSRYDQIINQKIY